MGIREFTHKSVLALLVLALVLLAGPAAAAGAVTADEPYTGVPGQGSSGRSNDCPGQIYWDTGMFDEYTVPTGCSSAGSAGCFVNAINDGAFPVNGRQMADDFEFNVAASIGMVKIWARYSLSGNAYHLANPGSIHGFCVTFYEQNASALWCPDGTVAGPSAIGTIVGSGVDGQYCPTFTEYEITSGVPRNWNYCITLPTPVPVRPGKVYWISVSADFDFTLYDDPATPAADAGVTQFFNRVYVGGYDPYCEASWWDTWNTPSTNWNAMSVALNIPCWAGWNTGFVLYGYEGLPELGSCCIIPSPDCFQSTEADCPGSWYAGQPCTPNPCLSDPAEEKSWGTIKKLYHR